MDLIKQIARDNNQTIVMVTHDKRLAGYADKIIHILDGKIQQVEVLRDITNPEEYSKSSEYSLQAFSEEENDSTEDAKFEEAQKLISATTEVKEEN